jgi:hypothetical protein
MGKTCSIWSTKFKSENLKGVDLLEDLSIGGRVILKYIFIKWGVRVWTQLLSFRVGIRDLLL